MQTQQIRTITKIEANPLLTSKTNEYRQLRVAAYCRVSTNEDDQINSYNAQVAFYTEHICSNPLWRFAGIYADEGITGTLVHKRERFKAMIHDCEKGKIDLILTKSVSRFARNTVDSLNYVRKLKAMNIGVFFEEQNLNSLTADSETFIGLYSVIAQSESENISANVRWGIQQRMKNGTYSFRFNILGYRKGQDGEPEIVQDEAETIRKIFDMYLDGNSLNQIKAYLEDNGKCTKTGKTVWDKRILKTILQNEKYAGDLLMQKTFRTDCITKKTKKNNGELPKYLITNNHPAIIDRDTFKHVQLEIARRANKKRISDFAVTELGKYSGKYALSELLICGECGSHYRRRTSYDTHKNKRIYWRCLNRIEHGTKYCSKSIGVEEYRLHEAICKTLSSALPKREEILSIILSTLNYAVTGNSETLNVYNIELHIKQLQEQATELIDLASRTEGNLEKYEEEIKKIFSKIKSLRDSLQIAREQSCDSENLSFEVKRIKEIFEKEDLKFHEFDNTIIRRIVECIRVMSDKTIIIILKGGVELKGKIE